MLILDQAGTVLDEVDRCFAAASKVQFQETFDVVNGVRPATLRRHGFGVLAAPGLSSVIVTLPNGAYFAAGMYEKGSITTITVFDIEKNKNYLNLLKTVVSLETVSLMLCTELN